MMLTLQHTLSDMHQNRTEKQTNRITYTLITFLSLKKKKFMNQMIIKAYGIM